MTLSGKDCFPVIKSKCDDGFKTLEAIKDEEGVISLFELSYN